MKDITYVGLDVHKATICVAIAESGRGGEERLAYSRTAPMSCAKRAARTCIVESSSYWATAYLLFYGLWQVDQMNIGHGVMLAHAKGGQPKPPCIARYPRRRAAYQLSDSSF
jgi:hypothetical protein